MSDQMFNVKFVGQVEKHPELYNYSLPEYTRKDLVEKGWNEIGDKMNMTVQECKERWKNIKSVFARHLKPSLHSSGTRKRKPYYLMDAMQFALPFVRAAGETKAMKAAKRMKVENTVDRENLSPIPGQVLSSHLDEDVEYQEDNLEEWEECPSSEIPPDPLAVPQEQALLSLSESVFHSDQSLQSQSPLAAQYSHSSNDLPGPSNPQMKTSINERKREASNVESFIELIKVREPKLSSRKDQRSEALKYFLLSLLPELEAMSEEEVKQFRRKVFQLIDEITAPESPS